jgi:hypothetical protein
MPVESRSEKPRLFECSSNGRLPKLAEIGEEKAIYEPGSFSSHWTETVVSGRIAARLFPANALLTTTPNGH